MFYIDAGCNRGSSSRVTNLNCWEPTGGQPRSKTIRLLSLDPRRKAEWFRLLLCCILIFFRSLLLYYLLLIRKKDLLIFLSAKANHLVSEDMKTTKTLAKFSVFFLNSPTKRRHNDRSICRVSCSSIYLLSLPIFSSANQIGKSAFFAQQQKPPFL